jgi:hypothetical protein
MLHLVGYKITQTANGDLCLVGRGTLLLWILSPLFFLIGVVLPITFAVDGFPNPVSAHEVSLAVFLLGLLVLISFWGLLYLFRFFPITSTIVFSGDTVTLTDIYMRGKQEKVFNLNKLREIYFMTVLPYKSLFKLTYISLIEKNGTTVSLVHAQLPMYSWQGRKAFRLLKPHLKQHGFSQLIKSEPDFNFF